MARSNHFGKNTGKVFEQTVYERLEIALATGSLGWQPTSARVYHQRAYYSRDRESDIKFDVSIELTIPGATVPSIIWVWECKDYGSSVPVDDVEEFNDKLNQVGAGNTKGTIITRGTYQISAINYARARGIGLARLMPDEQIEWVLYQLGPNDCGSQSAIPQLQRALTAPDFISLNQDFYALTSGGRTKLGLSFESFVLLQIQEWFPVR